MCPWNPGIELMSRWRFDMRTYLAVTSGKTSTTRTESETSALAKEDQRQQVKNNLTSQGKQYDLSKKLRVRVQQRLQIQLLLWNPASGETQSRPGSVLVQTSGHVDDDVQISALDAFYEMDGRKSRYIGEVLEWYRGEDAGDLKRSELNEFWSRI